MRLPRPGARVDSVPRVEQPAGVRRGQVDVRRLVGAARVVGVEAVEVDRERRPRRQRRVEEVDGEVARDPAVREPADVGDERLRREDGPSPTASSASRVALAVMSSAWSGTALIRSGKLRLIRAATTTGRSSGCGEAGEAAPARRGVAAPAPPSRPAPTGGGCASIHATIRSGKSRRSSAGSKRSSRLDHGIRCGRRCVTFVVITWSSMPFARRSPKVSGPPSSLPARSSSRSASHGVRAGVRLPLAARGRSRGRTRCAPSARRQPERDPQRRAPARGRAARERRRRRPRRRRARPEPAQSASTASATPGATPASAVRGKPPSAAPATRSHLPTRPVRPSPAARSRKYGRVRRWAGRAGGGCPRRRSTRGALRASRSPPCSRPCSAAAARGGGDRARRRPADVREPVRHARARRARAGRRRRS